MKRYLSKMIAVLLSALLVVAVPLQVVGQTLPSADGYTYEELADGTIRLTESSLWNFLNGVLTVPRELNGKPVTVIGEGVYHDRSMTSVVIPEGVTTIEQGAFARCHQLTAAYFPSTLQILGQGAFDGTKLTCAVFPKGMTEIGEQAVGYLRIRDPAFDSPLITMLVKNSRFIIYGYSGTAAQTYAQDNEMPFGDLATFQKGDVADFNQCVTMEDCLFLYTAVSGSNSLDPLQTVLADMNDDGGVNTLDAMLCYLKVSGAIA